MFTYINIAGREISVYGCSAAIGLIAAVLYLKVNVRRKPFADLDRNLEIALLYALAGTALGSKLLYLLIEARHIIENITEYGLVCTGTVYFRGGFAFFGGLFGCISALYIYSKRAGISYSHLIQLMMPAFPLAHSISRIGCLLTGCCYGKESSLPFAVTYTCSQYAPNGVPLIPIQLFEAIYELILFLILRKASIVSKPGGAILSEYLVLYGIGRFILELFRGDYYRGIIGVLSVAQIISIICISAGVAIIVRQK